MPRRIVAATAAVVLAVLGAVLLIGYVRGADARARDGEQLADVLVVTGDVAAGTSAGDLAGSVSVEQVPRRLVAHGAVSDLAALDGRVTTAALLPGDQVVTGRFADPATLVPEGTVAAPDGMVQVSVTLDAQRAVGGAVTSGDRVGVQLTEQSSANTGITGYSVFRVLHGVLVTRVTAPSNAGDPSAVWTVTLALSPDDASAVVLGTTAQAVWLSLEKAAPGGATATTTQTTTATLGDDK